MGEVAPRCQALAAGKGSVLQKDPPEKAGDTGAPAHSSQENHQGTTQGGTAHLRCTGSEAALPASRGAHWVTRAGPRWKLA